MRLGGKKKKKKLNPYGARRYIGRRHHIQFFQHFQLAEKKTFLVSPYLFISSLRSNIN